MATDPKFTKKILHDITGINLTDQEVAKLALYIRTSTSTNHLFSYINQIYSFIGANINNPGTILLIPFNDEKNIPHINIQRVAPKD